MIIVRPIELKDIVAFEKFAFDSSIGITNLPKNREQLHKKILSSLKSFGEEVTVPKNEEYIFVLENIPTGELEGTCAIFSTTGVPHPHYFYRIETLHPISKTLVLPKEIKILKILSTYEGPSEICGLYLTPNYRKEGLGRLLSLSRFLFIANFQHRFQETIIAEMRGYIDKKNQSPFWDGVGRKFMDMEFADLMALRDKRHDFLPEVLPEWPIYVATLPEETQKMIGKIHPETKPALKMLLKEGFHLTSDIDIFDGGPKIEANTAEIRTILQSRVIDINITNKKLDESDPLMLLSNLELDFRACFSKIKLISDESGLISQETAKALKVSKGHPIRFVSPKPSDPSLDKEKSYYAS